jgi:hypothetical protein
MKTKDLIKKLQEADPSGEEQCCIENSDIWDVIVEPAYYDGALVVIHERNEDNMPLKGKRVRTGNKVNITPITMQDAIEYDTFQVEYSNEDDKKRYEKIDIEHRRVYKRIDFEVEQRIFASWVFMKIQSLQLIPLSWVERIRETANKFYSENRGPDVDGKVIRSKIWKKSEGWADKLETIWDELIYVEWDNYSRIIIRFKEQNI